MKLIAPAALAALARGDAIVTGAVAIHCDPPIRVWGGYGPIDIGGETYQGIGDRGLAQVSSGAIGGAAQGVTLTLSGIEPEVIDLLDAEEVRRAPAVIWRMIFSGDGRTLLGANVFSRGRIDQVRTVETIGGAASIQVSVETAARGLGRRGGRMATDADQRLVKPTDGSFRSVSHAGEKMLYWGGLRPARAGAALGGGGGGGFGSGIDEHGFWTQHR
ncbi:MAG: hypothetical protein ACK4K7_03025 [Allosphingosinicella sp.]|uniref:hypothetical protein n=1 Tax=Allosphingosinicella sp. TaxID=2823234 RepID=UPI003923D6DF